MKFSLIVEARAAQRLLDGAQVHGETLRARIAWVERCRICNVKRPQCLKRHRAVRPGEREVDAEQEWVKDAEHVPVKSAEWDWAAKKVAGVPVFPSPRLAGARGLRLQLTSMRRPRAIELSELVPPRRGLPVPPFVEFSVEGPLEPLSACVADMNPPRQPRLWD